MTDWQSGALGDFVTFQRGFDITRATQRPGSIPVVSSGGVSSFHDRAAAKAPGVVIGRKGTLGSVFFMPDDYWPHDTTLWVRDFNGNYPRFVYYFMKQVDVLWLDAGSANPTLNRNHLHPLRVSWPFPTEQRAIAEVLGALDDKIAANVKLAGTSESLASELYTRGVKDQETHPMSNLLRPVLGGTPARARNDYWNGSNPWISARDITGAPNHVVIDTEERITDLAVESTKAKPLPIGSVILTARGTVGAVARLAEPASFNQSCYGFAPGPLPSSMLYFSVLSAAERAKAMAHGSVFDTITMGTFQHLEIPKLASDEMVALEGRLSPLLDIVTASVRENLTLAATRDALLPQLMSGKLQIKDAESLVADAM